MSAVLDTHGHAHHDDHGHHPSGIMRWIMTTNHKDIGTMYLWFSFIMFLVGGSMALVKIPPPTRAKSAMDEAPKLNPRTWLRTASLNSPPE